MQASDWAGAIGQTWAEEWVRTDRTFAPVDAALVAAIVARLARLAACRGPAHPRRRLRGRDGPACRSPKRCPARAITGVDLSPALIGAARARAGRRIGRCRFVAADAGRLGRRARLRSDRLAPRRDVLRRARRGARAYPRPRRARRPAALLLLPRARRSMPWASGARRARRRTRRPIRRRPAPSPSPTRRASPALLAAAGWRDAQAILARFRLCRRRRRRSRRRRDRLLPPHRPHRLRDAPPPTSADRQRLRDGLAALVRRPSRRRPHVVFPAAAWIWSATA